MALIEDPYSIEQMREPRMNVLIVKPLVDRLYDEDDISIGTYSRHSSKPLLTGDSILFTCESHAVSTRTAIPATPPNRRPYQSQYV